MKKVKRRFILKSLVLSLAALIGSRPESRNDSKQPPEKELKTADFYKPHDLAG